MRVTIELDDEIHERVSQLARQRGNRGLSTVVQTALDLYLSGLDATEIDAAGIDAALALRGSVSDESAEEMLDVLRETRP